MRAACRKNISYTLIHIFLFSVSLRCEICRTFRIQIGCTHARKTKNQRIAFLINRYGHIAMTGRAHCQRQVELFNFNLFCHCFVTNADTHHQLRKCVRAWGVGVFTIQEQPCSRSVCPSVRPSVCLSVHLFALSWLNCLTYDVHNIWYLVASAHLSVQSTATRVITSVMFFSVRLLSIGVCGYLRGCG